MKEVGGMQGSALGGRGRSMRQVCVCGGKLGVVCMSEGGGGGGHISVVCGHGR